MHCPKCQKEHADDAKYCTECGANLRSSAPIPDESDNPSDMQTIQGAELSEDGSLPDEMQTIVGGSGGDSGSTSSISNRFEMQGELGSGGMGSVHRARDRKLGRIVALKCLRAESAENQKAIERFWREAKVVASLSHFNIVQVYDVLEDGRDLWIVMEYVPGGSLQDKMDKSGALEPEQVREIGVQLAGALSAAHEKGIIHRDIKPGNILLSEKGTPKLGDFGLAHESEAEVQMTMVGSQMGTMYYASPEQMISGQGVDERSDIYSLGATLYALATGSSPRSIRLDRVNDEGLRGVIGKCLEEHPDKRYSTVDHLNEALHCDAVVSAPPLITTSDIGCPSCGHTNPVDVKFCHKCGGDLSELFVKCPKCQRDIRRDIEYCGGCGLARDEHEAFLEELKSGKNKIADYEDKVDNLKEIMLDAGKALEGQKKAADELGLMPEIACQLTGMRFRLIPAGKFVMGSPENEPGRRDVEGPQRVVTLTDPFYLGIYPVTREQYQKVMDINNSSRQDRQLPIDGVSWDDALEFCRKLSVQTSRDYSIPTEAQWEYACRGGTTTAYYFGDDPELLHEYAWFRDNSSSSKHPVGRKKPNNFGLYDMHGYVWEWCLDWYQASYKELSCDDPLGPQVGNTRILRGGGLLSRDWICRSAYRTTFFPSSRSPGYGFRVVLTPSISS